MLGWGGWGVDRKWVGAQTQALLTCGQSLIPRESLGV